ncbi:glutamate racemase [Spongiibacter sp.]|uniref:glutamate racemase n=1 Tax=Spongiibacter sp. TaxID=2024860 RepID=UPI00356B2A7E
MSESQHTPRVLIFDSGVGALSVGAEIHQLLPNIDLLYAMDRGGFPYGLWQESALVEHICARVSDILQRHHADLLVMACNSASTTVLPALRQQLHIPVVGVVPAIKPAAAQSRSRVIGLLATPGTVQRRYTAELIRDFAGDCCVISVGDADLAPAVERLFWQGEESPEVWQQVAAQFRRHPRAKELDTIVLACTHFPLVQPQLAKELAGLHWVDSGAAIARRVKQLLQERGWPTTGPREATQQVVILGAENASAALRERLLERGLTLSAD